MNKNEKKKMREGIKNYRVIERHYIKLGDGGRDYILNDESFQKWNYWCE